MNNLDKALSIEGKDVYHNGKPCDSKDWLNPAEVQKEYGFSVSTLAKWRMQNKYLSFSKIGKYIRYKRKDIEALLDSRIIHAIKINQGETR